MATAHALTLSAIGRRREVTGLAFDPGAGVSPVPPIESGTLIIDAVDGEGQLLPWPCFRLTLDLVHIPYGHYVCDGDHGDMDPLLGRVAVAILMVEGAMTVTVTEQRLSRDGWQPVSTTESIEFIAAGQATVRFVHAPAASG